MARKKVESEKNLGGRPSKYNKEIADKICHIISISTDGLRKICKNNPEFPTSETILEWRIRFPEFSSQYDLAKKHQADLLVEEILEIADDDSGDYIYTDDGVRMNSEFVARSKVKIEARKWIACKLLPKVYGDKLQTENVHEMKHEDRLGFLK